MCTRVERGKLGQHGLCMRVGRGQLGQLRHDARLGVSVRPVEKNVMNV